MASTEKPKSPLFHDLEGSRYGYLLVTSFSEVRKKRTYWNVKCDCGVEKEVGARHLVLGNTISCGCMKPKLARKMHTTHGEGHGKSTTQEYRSWYGMRSRCSDPNNDKYYLYGDRGITFCDRWNSYEYFLEDMGRRPTPSHSLDRIDNELGYCPANCRWATKKEQVRNRRTTIMLEYDGRTQCQSDWAEEFGLSKSLLSGRIRNGWTVERALTTPVKKKKSSNSEDE